MTVAWARRWPPARSSTRSPRPALGILLLGEHLHLGIAGGAVGFAGLAATVVGLTVLARTHHEPKTPAAVS